MMCKFNSQSYTFVFKEQFANTAFVESAIGYFGLHWSLRWQRKYPQIKTKRKTSEKLICDVWIHIPEMHFLMEQFVSTIFGESEMGYFRSHWILHWQWKCPQIKTGKKLSESLLCDVWMHHTELHLSVHEAVCSHCFCGNCKGIFGNVLRPMWKRTYPRIKSRKKFSEKLHCGVGMHLTELHRAFHWAVC